MNELPMTRLVWYQNNKPLRKSEAFWLIVISVGNSFSRFSNFTFNTILDDMPVIKPCVLVSSAQSSMENGYSITWEKEAVIAIVNNDKIYLESGSGRVEVKNIFRLWLWSNE